MNAQTPSRMLSDAIREVAMVAGVTTSALGLTRTDRDASKKADSDHAARIGSARVVVDRLSGAADYAKRIMDCQTMAHANLKQFTMPWGSTGRRLLPTVNHERWNKQHQDIKHAFDVAVKDFVDNADHVIAIAKQNLGDYKVKVPTKEEIETAYSLSFTLEPIPDSAAFRGPPEVEEYLKRQFEANIQAAHAEAQANVLTRLSDPLKKLIERMDAYDKREAEVSAGKAPTKEGIFRDSVIENVHSIADVFESFNLLGDPKLAEVADALKVFRQINADMLRKHDTVRRAASIKAKEILDGLGLL